MPAANGQQPVTNASTSSIRRNIFHTQLSGRPKSSTSDRSTSSATHSHSNGLHNFPSVPLIDTQPPSNSSCPSSLRLQSQKTSSTSTEETSDPPSGDIIARDPTSRRPILPTLPTLPPHLRLSSEQDPGPNGDPASNEAEDGYASQFGIEDAMREKQETARIEKSLVEMMYRSRNRAQGHATRPGSGVTEGLGAECQELLELVKASLRKKAAGLEDDRWMYEAEG